ncbi:MAG: toxin-antitoxin system YwqK family antitoxin, partial [Bdellovibrionia bacterium]
MKPWGALVLILSLLSLSSCMTTRRHPCLEGGEPPRDVPFNGDRKCMQKRGPDGKYVNNGLYREWHPNGKLALEGFYKMGKKDGQWTEYDPTGHKVSTKYFEEGEEAPLKKP